MDIMTWAAIAGGALLVAIAAYVLPARTIIRIDTAGSTARAEMRLLGGLGPLVVSRALPRSAGGSPLALFNDAVRIGHALMTPSLADAAYVAVQRLFRHKPRAMRIALGLNLVDNAQNVVVQTAAEAAIAVAPAALRECVSIYKCEAPGAELAADFELSASPLALSSIYSDFKNSRPVREFRRRLKTKPKPAKKPVREVRAA